MRGTHYVYILASKRGSTLFVGTEEELSECRLEHRANLVGGLTSQYAIHQLVFWEIRTDRGAALARANEFRLLSPGLKLQLIESINPDWRELYGNLAAGSAVTLF